MCDESHYFFVWIELSRDYSSYSGNLYKNWLNRFIPLRNRVGFIVYPGNIEIKWSLELLPLFYLFFFFFNFNAKIGSIDYVFFFFFCVIVEINKRRSVVFQEIFNSILVVY